MEYTFYKIVCNDINTKYCYVGSTKNFTRRKCQHKKRCTDETRNHQRLYTTINENGGFQNWTMVMIEHVVCETKLEARKRERHWYDELNADLNQLSPHTEKEERVIKQKIRSKQHYEQHIDDYTEYKKEYYIQNKERASMLAKIYYEKNKEKIKEQVKLYAQNNKEKIKAYNKARIGR